MMTSKAIEQWMLLILFIYLVIEAGCYIGLFIGESWIGSSSLQYSPVISVLSDRQKAILKRFMQNPIGSVVAYDSQLGWVTVAETNSAGMRDDQEYTEGKRPNVIRLSSFGDSFTYGSDVRLNETWQKQLSNLNPSFEVLNYGCGAYGLDQAYLRYLRDGSTYHPNIVFIGYMSENIARNVNVYRPFYSDHYRNEIFSKPRFTVKNGELILLRNLTSTTQDFKDFIERDKEYLSRLGETDYHYQTRYREGPFDFLPSVRFFKVAWHVLTVRLIRPIYNLSGIYEENSEAFKVTAAIFDAFYQKVLENGALPIVLIYPNPNDRRRSRMNKPRSYTPLLEYFAVKGYRYIDLMTAFEPYHHQYNAEDFMVSWGHFSPLAHKITAQYIYSYLQKEGLTDFSGITQAIQKEGRR